MRTFLRTIIFGTALAALGVHVAAQTADPLIGTWELNIAKSKYNSGPAPKSETRTYVVVGQDIKATSEGVDADGKPTSGQWTVNYDGKDRPATGRPDLDALSVKRIDAFTAEFTQNFFGDATAGSPLIDLASSKALFTFSSSPSSASTTAPSEPPTPPEAR